MPSSAPQIPAALKAALEQRLKDRSHGVGLNSFWFRFRDAARRVEIPGDLDGLATAEYAYIEEPGYVRVFVSDMEEGVDFDPDHCRSLAFSLLVLADLAEDADTTKEGTDGC